MEIQEFEVRNLKFADGNNLIKESLAIFQEILELFTQEENHYNLKININKTKTLVFRKDTPITLLEINNEDMETAKQLISLANLTTSTTSAQ